LRADAAQRVLRDTMHASPERFGLRLVHFSAQRDHLHLIAEADDGRAVSRGMQSFAIRLALALNRLWRRKGAVLGDRYHARALRTPREVRVALAYVLCNARKHGERFLGALDPCSSAPAFDGWRELRTRPRASSLLARARTWLLALGWKLHGPISIRGP
jgi:putative transposase